MPNDYTVDQSFFRDRPIQQALLRYSGIINSHQRVLETNDSLAIEEENRLTDIIELAGNAIRSLHTLRNAQSISQAETVRRDLARIDGCLAALNVPLSGIVPSLSDRLRAVSLDTIEAAGLSRSQLEELDDVRNELENQDWLNRPMPESPTIGLPNRPIYPINTPTPAVFNSQKCELSLHTTSNKLLLSIATERHSYRKHIVALLKTDFGLILRRELFTEARPNRNPQPTFGLMLASTDSGYTKILEIKESE
jgi:hypothetical protein